MAIAGIVYAGLTLTYARSYLEIEMPTALLAYWSYNSPLQEVFRSAAILLAPAAMLLAVGLSGPSKRRANFGTCTSLGSSRCSKLCCRADPSKALVLPLPPRHHVSSISQQSPSSPQKIHALTNLRLRRIAFAILVVMAIAPTAFEAVRTFEGASSRESQLAAMFRNNPGPNRTVFGFIPSPRDVFPAVIAAEHGMGSTVLLRISHRRGRARRRSASRLPTENKGGRIKSGGNGDFCRAHQRARGHRYCDRQ